MPLSSTTGGPDVLAKVSTYTFNIELQIISISSDYVVVSFLEMSFVFYRQTIYTMLAVSGAIKIISYKNLFSTSNTHIKDIILLAILEHVFYVQFYNMPPCSWLQGIRS